MSITINGSTGIQANNLQGILDLAVAGNTTLGDASADLVTINGDTINIASSGAKITGDFSNATIANRVAFQSSTTNGGTQIGLIPNGTNVISGHQYRNSSDASNYGQFLARITGTEAQLSSSIVGTGSYVPITFYTGGSERLRIDTSGNVGIGSTTSLSRLTVFSTTSTVANGASTRAPIASIRGGNDNNRCEIYVDNSSANTIVGFGAYNTAGAGTEMAFYTGAAVSERLRIDTNGNVGIGTSTPSSFSGYSTVSVNNTIGGIYNIHVNGTETARLQAYTGSFNVAAKGAATVLTFETNGSERMRIDANGNVGIGFSGAISEKLFVNNGSLYVNEGLCKTNRANASASTVNGFGLYIDGGLHAQIYTPTASTLAINTAGIERLRVDASGNLGINITPVFKIHSYATGGSTIAGAFRTDQSACYISFRDSTTASDISCRIGVVGENLVFLTNGSVERFRVGSSGEIGIGGANYGTSGQVLTSNGSGAAPTWSTVTGSGVGIGQTWTDVTASRASGTTYTNSTGKPIEVLVKVSNVGTTNNSCSLSAVVSGVTVTSAYDFYNGAVSNTVQSNIGFIVPNGATYSVTISGSTVTWTELR